MTFSPIVPQAMSFITWATFLLVGVRQELIIKHLQKTIPYYMSIKRLFPRGRQALQTQFYVDSENTSETLCWRNWSSRCFWL